MDLPIDKNAAFLWSIIAMGIALPLLLAVYALVKSSLAKSRLARLKNDDVESRADKR